MPIFKTLLPERPGEGLLCGALKNGWETWDCLESALNELGVSNWEIGTPLYGSFPNSGNIGTTGPIALVLVNQEIGMEDEWERQMEKLRAEIAALHALIECPSDVETIEPMLNERILQRQRLLDDLLKKFESVSVD